MSQLTLVKVELEAQMSADNRFQVNTTEHLFAPVLFHESVKSVLTSYQAAQKNLRSGKLHVYHFS